MDEAERVDLARTAPFALGPLAVNPAVREVAGEGARTILEPRIMQVLVALARRRGEVVSRDELIGACWEGRIVGDDAIHRCIARLRQLAASSSAFAIETIARVGFRLTEAAGGESGGPVLAVLPFDNLSSDPQLGYFSDGVSEEILTTAARIAGLRVISSASSFAFRGPRKAEAAAALGASHLLNGSVRPGGARLRITVELSDAASGTVLWSERYDRPAADLFALEDEIAGKTAATLSQSFTPAEPQGAVGAEALDLYLKALALRRTYEVHANEGCIALLQQAVALAPAFARAQGALALALCHRIGGRGAEGAAFEAAVAAARGTAERALARDPEDRDGRFALLSLEPCLDNWARVEAQLAEAVQAAPNDGELLRAFRTHLSGVGRFQEAGRYHQRAHALDPSSPRAMSIEVSDRLWRRDLAGARALCDRALAAAPGDEMVWNMCFSFYCVTARWADAAASVELAAANGVLAEPLRTVFAEALAFRRGEVDEAAYLEAMAALAELSPFLVFRAFWFLALSGHLDQAFDILEAAMAREPPEQLWSRWNANSQYVLGAYQLIRWSTQGGGPHPRLLAICARIGLCRYWVETGRWPDFIVRSPDRAGLEDQARRLTA